MNVVVTGASSQIGRFLLPRLVAAGHAVAAISRMPPAGADKVRWLAGDLSRPREITWPDATVLIHLAPIRLLPELLPAFLGASGHRVIAIGTTSRDAKQASANAHERDFAAAQAEAEAILAEACARAAAHWTVLRPTLIYGCGMDRNVTFIARAIRRFGFFPLFGAAAGRRQPIHADDIAAACVAVIENPRAFDRAYHLTGGETLSYRDMVSRIFVALGRKPRFLHVPLPLLGAALRLLSLLPRYRDFNIEMAKRMNEDLVFDCSSARQDFGYAPRSFQPEFPDA